MDVHHDPKDMPAWRSDLQAQVLLRNVMEEKPTQGIFASYMLLYERARRLQTVEKEHQRVSDELMRVRARVHELEKAAANISVRTARELELQEKCDSLQHRVHELMVHENTYYKGLAEVSESRAKMSALEARVQWAEGELDRRLSEYNLVKKECTSMRDENALLRSRIAEAERTVADARKLVTQMSQMRQKNTAHEQEILSLRRQLAEQEVRLSAARASPATQDSEEGVTKRAASMHTASPRPRRLLLVLRLVLLLLRQTAAPHSRLPIPSALPPSSPTPIAGLRFTRYA